MAQPRRHGGARLPANAVATTQSPPVQMQSPYQSSSTAVHSSPTSNSSGSQAGSRRHGGARLPSGASSTVAENLNAPNRTPNGRPIPTHHDSPSSFSQASTWQASPTSYDKRPVDGFQDVISPVSSQQTAVYPGSYGPNNPFTPTNLAAPPPVFNDATMAYQTSHKGSMSGVSVQTNEVPTYRGKDGTTMVSESQVHLKERPELQSSSYHAPLVTRRRMHQKGYRNLFSQRTRFRWPKSFHSHQWAGVIFANSSVLRHRDAVNRIHKGIEDDRFIALDRHIERMMVQCTDDLYEGPCNSTWRRTFVRNMAPWAVRIANWPVNTTPIDSNHWSSADWVWVVVKWPVSCFLLIFTLLKIGPLYDGVSPYARYSDFPYRFWGYPKIARNVLENIPGKQMADGNAHAGAHPVSERPLYPRRLCFVDSNGRDAGGIHLYDVELWLQQHNMIEHDMRFIVVAYTSTQFSDSDEDTEALHAIAREAAIQNKCPAYWVGSACMSDDPQELEQDVYRISDVIRAAYAVVIAVKPQSGNQTASIDGLLKDWGSRMWTLPEALLAPKDKPIQIYNTHLGQSQFVKELPKKDLAALVWEDTSLTRQLVDHYEGNLTLSRLELVILALKCLSQRRTSKYLDGDLAYVLMGLLRRRPVIDHTDTEFQAFARLSLANDSDNLLERLICILPKVETQPWYHANDMYNVNLWDIQPTCQIAGVCEDDTVVLDGVMGAAIRWESFVAVAHDTAWSWKRLFAKMWLRISGLILIILVFIGQFLSPGFVVILLILCLPAVIASPWLVRVLYGGKIWNAAPHLLGFEGYLDIATIETNIYGHYTGRLAWSPAGSPLSRHQMNEYGECVGQDPTGDGHVADMVKQAKYSKFGELKVFTLVDTCNGVVTLFTAARPPIAALLCAQEGGMQRAVMVSLDWKTGTLFRETVLRMPTVMLSKLWRVDRVKVGLKRPLGRTILRESV